MGDRNARLDIPHEVIDQREQDKAERGATLVEYVLMISLIALVCTMALGYFQDETVESLSASSSSLSQAGT